MNWMKTQRLWAIATPLLYCSTGPGFTATLEIEDDLEIIDSLGNPPTEGRADLSIRAMLRHGSQTALSLNDDVPVPARMQR